MANLSENPQWVDGIYQIETSDPVAGGPDGVSNRQAKELASRTRYLKKEQEKTGSDLATHAAAADPHTQYAPKDNPTFTGTPKAPTPATDSNSQQVATTAFVKSVAATKLAKDQNGADIQDRELFNRNLGSSRAYSSSIPIGGSAGLWTTAEFIGWLESQGAFVHAYWVCRGSWSYTHNKIISDTECGQIPLAGSVVEVMGQNGATTIRVTTPSTAPGGLSDSANAQFTYVYNGFDYSPGWRRDYNTKNKPTAADIGALPEKAVAQAAAKLSTPRTINGVPFDGTANITLTPANLGLTETVSLAAGSLEKSKHGVDIPDKKQFAKNVSLPYLGSGWVHFGGSVGAWTTSQFIDFLDGMGAFQHLYFVCSGSWSYELNRKITDTGCGNIELSGAVVECFGDRYQCRTIRVTTATTSSDPDAVQGVFIYIDNGADSAPGWRREYNSKNLNVHQTCSAWVRFNENGEINDSYNVSAVVKNSTGDFTIKFKTRMKNENYAFTYTVGGRGDSMNMCSGASQLPSRDSFRVISVSSPGIGKGGDFRLLDFPVNSISVFGGI
ncbi:hypothetical protein [Pectobacterium carotovorum]|uniref:hypothetical protein n=1 Tax=Pectobacterium carotovorum TaxID=554 RepID=UPI001F488D43|nr:hypothetical protein [Pectobacterium carotovorum]